MTSRRRRPGTLLVEFRSRRWRHPAVVEPATSRCQAVRFRATSSEPACFLDRIEIRFEVGILGPPAHVALVPTLAELAPQLRIPPELLHSFDELLLGLIYEAAAAPLDAFGQRAHVVHDDGRLSCESVQAD